MVLKQEKKISNIKIICSVFILLIFTIIPVSAVDTAELLWSKQMGGTYNTVNAIDTTSNGSVLFVGMTNGSIISFDYMSNVLWMNTTNASIKFLKSDEEGDIVWANTKNESGLISFDGSVRYFRNDSFRNITDIGISRDGAFLSIIEKYPARISVIRADTGEVTTTSPSGYANLTHMAFDPYANWIALTTNETTATTITNTNITLYNLSIFNGWLDFNPYKDSPKNTSQTHLDSFSYRRNISIDNAGTAATHIYFKNVSANTTSITRINDTYYEYAGLNTGKYFYWTTYGNFTDQTSVINTSHYLTSDLMLIELKKGIPKNLTLYYGNKSYKSPINNTYSSFSTYSTDGSFTFTLPSPSPSSVGYTAIGAGGGGKNAVSSSSGGVHGYGGSAGTTISGTLNIYPGQTTIPIVVGTGGTDTNPGSASTINGTLTANGGAGATSTSGFSNGGNGANGGINATRYATNGTYGEGNAATSCAVNSYLGGTGGTGFGAGGGAGGSHYTSDCGAMAANGGKGAQGYVNLTYNVIEIVLGSAPNHAYLFAEQTQSSGSSIVYVSKQVLGGNITSIDTPEMGAWIGVATDEPKVYHQQVDGVGFGTQYSGTANTGPNKMIKTADSAAYSIEARSLMMDIYQLDGTRKGTYTSGGVVNTVDVAVKNGLWWVGGGDDGKVYIFSKDATSSLYVYYQGDSEAPIISSAISWRGEYVGIGRDDGMLEYYTTSGVAASGVTSYTLNVFVNKGGTPFAAADIIVTTGDTMNDAITAYKTGKTDSYGKFAFTATDLKYYKINVNNGEYVATYQATSTYTTITINIPKAMINRPYDYSTSFDDSTSTITTVYSDVDIATVNISIVDMSNNTIMHWGNYTSTTVTDVFATGNSSHEYKVNMAFTRSTGHTYTDTLYTKSSLFGQSSGVVPTQWVLFKYAIYSVMLMFVALGIGAASTKWGVIILPSLTVLGIIIGFLPANLYTGGLLVSAFIAMLEVMRRRPD